MKVSLLRGTGLVLPSVSDPLIIVWVELLSNLCNTLDRLWRSETGFSVTLKSLPVLNGFSSKKEPLKALTREVWVAEVRTVNTLCI